MSQPVMIVRVWIDFDNDGAYGTTDEVTAYYKDIRGRVGIDRADQRVAPAGELLLVLNNTDRRFSPGNTSGPYYGKILPNLPVLVQVSDGTANTWSVFTGRTEEWTIAVGQRGTREASVSCTDLIGVLQDAEMAIPLQRDKRPDELLAIIVSTAFRSARAEGTFTFSAVPAANDTVTVDDATYKFKTSLSVANDVIIGTRQNATAHESIENLVAAINGVTGLGAVYQSGLQPTNARATKLMSYYDLVRRDSAVRYYRLSEPSGTTAYDSGTNGTAGNGTYSGVTLNVAGALSGDFDAAASFDGVNDSVSLPVIDIKNSSFTIECWAYADSLATNRSVVTFFTAAAAGQIANIQMRDDGTLRFAFFSDDLDTAAGAVTAGAWYHIVCVYNAANDTSKIYLNGAEAASGSHGPMTVTPTRLDIGYYHGATQYFGGDIDEVAIYLYPLTAAQVAEHYAARAVQVGLTIAATARGTWGNAIAISEASGVITASGAVLSGGVDGPTTGFDYDTAKTTIDAAGDDWAGDSTNAMHAIADLMDTERGYFWVDRAGMPTFRNRDFIFTQTAATPALTLDSQHNEVEGGVRTAEVVNRVTVNTRPKTTLSTGQVARLESPVTVQGVWGEDRANPSDDLPGGGSKTVKLKYTDPGTGRFIGVDSITLPLTPGTDFTVTEPFGADYSSRTDVYALSVAMNGGDLEATFRNRALGALTFSNLVVNGVGRVAYDPVGITLEDTTSISAYRLRSQRLSMPLPITNAENVARAVGQYELGRFKDPAMRFGRLDFREQRVINGVNLFSLDIGDTLTLSDFQTGVSAHRYMITGMQYQIRPKSTGIILYVLRLDDRTYGIFDDTTYGKLDTTMRFAI